MQKSNANEMAKKIISNAKLIFEDRINNITFSSVTDEPYKMFSIKFTLYNYYIIVYNYDRGHFGCSIIFGDDTVTLQSNVEWDDECNYASYWKEIDRLVRLRIPDKYLKEYGWL